MRFRKPTLYKKRKTRIIRNKRIQTPNKRIQTRNKRIKTRRKIRHYILGGAGEDETNVSAAVEDTGISDAKDETIVPPERDKKNSKEILQNSIEIVENDNQSFLVAANRVLPQYKSDFSLNSAELQRVIHEKKPSMLTFNFETNKRKRIADLEFNVYRNRKFFNDVVDELKENKQRLLDMTDRYINKMQMFESYISDENPFISKIAKLQTQREEINSIDFDKPEYSKIV